MLPKLLIIIAFFLSLSKDINLIKKLVIPAKRTNLEKIALFLGTLVLLTITYYFAKSVVDYIFAAVAITALIVMPFKQGIREDGLTLNERMLKEKYNWTDLGYVKIKESDVITVSYFSKIGSPIIKQHYAKANKEKLLTILGENTKIETNL